MKGDVEVRHIDLAFVSSLCATHFKSKTSRLLSQHTQNLNVPSNSGRIQKGFVIFIWKNITQKYILFKQVILSYKERLFVYYSNYMPQKENLLFAAGSDLDHYSSN